MKLSIAVSSLLLTTSNTLAFGPAPSRSHAVTNSGLLSTTETDAQQKHSMDFSQFPRRSYLQDATPIEEMKKLSKALGGEVNLYVKRNDLLPRNAKLFIIPRGASTPIGTLGYAECAQVIMNQLDTIDLKIDHVVLASASSGTHAGMVAGMAGLKSSMKLHGMAWESNPRLSSSRIRSSAKGVGLPS